MQKLTLKGFKENYYYKTDLEKLCKQYKLPSYGTKAELNHYLQLYLSGKPPQEIKAVRSSHHNNSGVKQINLNTKIVGSRFSFNNEARKFFANYFGVKNFHFKKGMAIIKRKAEAENDTNMTVADLINEYTKLKKTPNRSKILKRTSEENTYQWNNFVKNFCQSPESKKFNNKLKVAAILWQHVRNSSKPKKYRPELINIYQSEIKQYKK
ncbi:SAP domain-containing protein [Lactobacillus acetotolerans]|jgi:hypothetical protein|uniref:SAP domain-containing protein n=2 Tax=Lactobacillus acetotolerans TaxID=1600 RepID=A0A0D6A2T8_9LACO|nr:SAP domain-containing protein [Lactobacillus acetotolerans]MBN7275965.1 hypothetical protein [Lactobacillus acetotolerans]QFG51063.1 hypothetical protein LA749_03245 [Lactobacillus acetotolerans]QGV04831.1 hypothetical protein GJR85_05080 [Lactobacillus acetotolerans]BAQ56994.1 conserved hypothetical protein [Lactobacillus acetotolerans]GGV11373.1 hypothetical protein GCM10011628_05990 [Lactobacillus acetotolerans DSM 20749 = JCM 3825]